MLVRGWVDCAGNRPYLRSEEELKAYDTRRRRGDMARDPLSDEEKNEPSFENLLKDMQGNAKKPRSCRTLWLQLRTIFKKIRLLIKRQRDNKLVHVSTGCCRHLDACMLGHACGYVQAQ
jgi:hypothetical protein